MTDYTKLSNEDLMAIAGGSISPKENDTGKKNDFKNYSNSQLLALVDGKSPEELPKRGTDYVSKYVLEPIGAVGRTVDRFTGAPTRAAIGAIQQGENPLSAAWQQFGADPEKAPTGKDIAARAGISTEQYQVPGLKSLSGEPLTVSPAGAVGLGVDIVADPTNLIPVVAGSKIAGKGAFKLFSEGANAATKATDVVTGTRVASSAYDATKSVSEGARLALDKLFNPKIKPDFKELAAIAEKNNIPKELLPSTIEFGPESIITRAERVKAEGPLGQKDLERYELGHLKVRDALENKIGSIAGGPILSAQEAGNYIRKSYDEAVTNFFETVDTSYNGIINDYPGLKISERKIPGTGVSPKDELDAALNGIEKFAIGRVKRGVTDLQVAQGKSLINSVNAIRSTNGSVKQTVEALRDIGEAAFKSQNTLAAIPADVEKMRKLYGDISTALMDTIKYDVTDGQALAGALQLNNERMSNFFGNKSAIANIIGNKYLSDEGVFNSLIKNGDSRKISALKEIFGAEAFDNTSKEMLVNQRLSPIKGAWLDSLIKRDVDESFNFKTIANTVRNKRNIIENILSPNEIQDFSDIVRLGDRFGNPIMSTSGTGASNSFKDIGKGLLNGVTSEAFVNNLKNRARNIETTAQTTLPKESPTTRNFQFDRTRLDNLLKGAQIESLQQQNQKKDAFQRRLDQLGAK